MKKQLAATFLTLLLVGPLAGHADHNHSTNADSVNETREPAPSSSNGFSSLIDQQSSAPLLVLVEIVVVLAAVILSVRHYRKTGDGDGILELGGK